MSGQPEWINEATEPVDTGWPIVTLLACRRCGVLLWDAVKHFNDAHPEAATHPVGGGQQ